MKETKTTCKILNMWLSFIFIWNQTFPYFKCDLNIQTVCGVTVYLLMKLNCLTGSFPSPVLIIQHLSTGIWDIMSSHKCTSAYYALIKFFKTLVHWICWVYERFGSPVPAWKKKKN